MKRHWLFGILASSLLVLVLGARPANAESAMGGYGGHSGTGSSNRTGRIAQNNNQDQAQADQQALKDAQDAKQKAQAKKDALAKKVADAKKKAADLAAAKKTATPTKTQATAAGPDTSEADAAKLCDQAEKKFDEGKMDSIVAGAKLLEQVIDDYSSTDSAAKAEARLEQLLTNPDLGPKIMLGLANDLFAAQRYRKAQNAFTELVAAFPNSPEAAEANQRLAEIRDGKLLEKTVYTEKELDDARLWLLAGNIHQENSRPSDALSAWRRVVEDYPGCRFAKEAGEHLAALPKS